MKIPNGFELNFFFNVGYLHLFSSEKKNSYYFSYSVKDKLDITVQHSFKGLMLFIILYYNSTFETRDIACNFPAQIYLAIQKYRMRCYSVIDTSNSYIMIKLMMCLCTNIDYSTVKISLFNFG